MKFKRIKNHLMESLGAEPSECPMFESNDGLVFIVTKQTELDEKRWVHISISRKDRLPSWFDLKAVKNFVLGGDKLAIQVLPPEEKFVNIHSNCLHLWHCEDGNPIPDFTWGTGSI